MGRVVFGLALMSLMLCSSAFAGDVPNSDSGGSRQLQKPSPPSQMHRPKSLKQVSGTPSVERSGSQSLPLSSAAAYASEHSASLPISSVPRAAPPPGNSWTGFHVGVGAGVGSTQP
jgi:hypothetical protein